MTRLSRPSRNKAAWGFAQARWAIIIPRSASYKNGDGWRTVHFRSRDKGTECLAISSSMSPALCGLWLARMYIAGAPQFAGTVFITRYRWSGQRRRRIFSTLATPSDSRRALSPRCAFRLPRGGSSVRAARMVCTWRRSLAGKNRGIQVGGLIVRLLAGVAHSRRYRSGAASRGRKAPRREADIGGCR